jgi:hypothetical protein
MVTKQQAIQIIDAMPEQFAISQLCDELDTAERIETFDLEDSYTIDEVELYLYKKINSESKNTEKSQG